MVVLLVRLYRGMQPRWKCVFAVFSQPSSHKCQRCYLLGKQMVKSDILIIFQTFINVFNWLLPSYTSRRNGCVHANPHANSHHRYIHSSIYFQMSPRKIQNWRVRGASGTPQDSIQLFVESPPAAAFNSDPEQQEKAKSCGGATRSEAAWGGGGQKAQSWTRFTTENKLPSFNVVNNDTQPPSSVWFLIQMWK